MITQLNLFTDIICDHCKTNPGFKPGKPQLWNGFYDQDTNQYFCKNCRQIHYVKKAKQLNLTNGMLYSEIPVVLPYVFK